MSRPPPQSAVSIRLTATAQAYADAQAVANAVLSARIGPDAAVGDMVSVETGGKRREFTIVTRRWIIANDASTLELVLDHPVRRGA